MQQPSTIMNCDGETNIYNEVVDSDMFMELAFDETWVVKT